MRLAPIEIQPVATTKAESNRSDSYFGPDEIPELSRST